MKKVGKKKLYKGFLSENISTTIKTAIVHKTILNCINNIMLNYANSIDL